MRNTRAYVPAAIMLAGALFVVNARTQGAVPLAAPLTTVLPQVDGYRTLDQKLGAEEQRVAGMTDYVARAYTRDSIMKFSTFVSYYDRQTQGKTIHSPRNCLPGAGWEVMTAGTANVPVDGAPQVLNRYTLKNQGATAVVYYWYQGRGRIVSNEYAVKWNLLRDAAVAGHTEEALVRVVVFVASSPPGDAAGARKNFDDAVTLGADVASRLAHDVRRVLPQG